MPRPKLSRTIQSPPPIDGFNPNGAGSAGEVVLSFEEFEAIRLNDFEGLDQSQAAVHMGISRQTFGRVLRSARFIISKALVKGFQLKVTGGCYHVRGQGHARGKGRGAGGQQRRHCGMETMEKHLESTGGTEMADDKKPTQQQDNTGNSNQGSGKGQGRGQGQGQGQRQGRGQGSGKGLGRGKGGGKGDGSCRRS